MYLQALEIVRQHAGMKPVLLRNFIIIPWSKHGLHGQKLTCNVPQMLESESLSQSKHCGRAVLQSQQSSVFILLLL